MTRPFDLSDILNFQDGVFEFLFDGLPGGSPADGQAAAAAAPIVVDGVPVEAVPPKGPVIEVPPVEGSVGNIRAPMDPDPVTGGDTSFSYEFAFAKPGSDETGGSSPRGGGGKPGSGDGGSGDGLVSSYTSGDDAVSDKNEYNIKIDFDGGGWTAELQQVFIYAADYLSTIILGDLSDERVPLVGRVDDITIAAQLVQIDGSGGILGQAGVSSYRNHDKLPASGVMQFDAADALDYYNAGLFDEIVLHEMLHCLGFGSQWDDLGLVTDFGGDLRFTGELATWEYNNGLDFSDVALTDSLSFDGVAIETDGGAGTEGAHWDEALYGGELMTGWIDPGGTYLSDMTIASLEDMGYDTIYDESVLAMA